MRLQKFFSDCGILSRRAAEAEIAAGKVKVNGVVAQIGDSIDPDVDVVEYNGKRIRPRTSTKRHYIMLNKPRGYVTTMQDEKGRPTVANLTAGVGTRVYPVGRLDKNSLGVLLMTNDGDLTKTLTHPSFEKRKVYQVTLDKPLTKAEMEQIVEGITLDDGFIQADEVSYVNESKKEVGIEIHSGRNRIVRRIFEHMGYTVTKLDRVLFAGLTKKNLKRGQWRFLTPQEVGMLKLGRYE